MAKRFVPAVLRVLLGLIFIAVSLIGLLGKTTPPPAYPAAAIAFLDALRHASYFIWQVQGVQSLAGLALVLDLWTPLALVVLAPVSVNILLFHLFLTPRLLFTVAAPGLVVFVLNAVLLWLYREHYRTLLVPRPGR